METKDINDLVGNAKNPRIMSQHDAAALKKSIQEFGDLSGIVFNVATGQLVGGHQRVETFKRMDGSKQVVISQRLPQPSKVGTIAIGYVVYNGETFGYREVDWPVDGTDDDGKPVSSKELAANIAANRIQGDWNEQLLAELDWWLKENNPDMLAMTGQDDDEINRLLNGVGGDETEEKYTKEIVAPTYEPSNEKPPLSMLVDDSHTKKLLAEIDVSTIDEDIKVFLRLAAQRHNVFDYGKIADYYAHSSADIQQLMENSALVIIDYNKAIELGYVKATREIMDIQQEDYPNEE